MSVQSLMTQLVAIQSVFPQEQNVVNFVEKYLQQLGFLVERVPAEPGRDSLIATYGEAQQYLCFYGHLDTVPADPLWQQDPFTVTVDGDIAHGLGVADMKGGVAAILTAAEYAVAHHLPLKLAFGVDEENISLGSYTLTQTDFFRDVAFIISAESGQIFNEDQAFAVNYGRKGRFVLEATMTGVTAHAARSDEAVNAISHVAKLITQLDQLQLPVHPHLGKTEVIPFFVHSETDAFSIPSQASLRLNILSVPGVTSQSMITQLNKLAQKLAIKARFELVARPTPYMESYEVSRQHPLITLFEEQVFAHHTVQPGYSISVADENRFAHALHIPVISMGPIGGGDHTAHEWVRLSSLEKTAQTYQELIEVFQAREKQL